MEIIEYYHNNQCPRPTADSSLVDAAAENGHLEAVKYLRQKGYEWNCMTCAFAAKTGQLEVLKYAHENGCLWDTWTCMQSGCGKRPA